MLWDKTFSFKESSSLLMQIKSMYRLDDLFDNINSYLLDFFSRSIFCAYL